MLAVDHDEVERGAGERAAEARRPHRREHAAEDEPAVRERALQLDAVHIASPSTLRPRPTARRVSRPPRSARLEHEDRDLPLGALLVVRVVREGGHGGGPERRALGVVGDLARAELHHLGAVAQRDVRVGAQVVDPDRVLGRAALRPNQHVVVAGLHPHQGHLADGAGLAALHRHEHDGHPAQLGTLGAVALLDALDLLGDPAGGAGDVVRHRLLLDMRGAD